MLAAVGPAAEAPGAPSKPLRLTAAMATEWTAQQDQELRQMVEVLQEGGGADSVADGGVAMVERARATASRL